MIETERLHIKKLEREHIEPLRQLRNEPTTRQWLTDNRTVTQGEQLKWYIGLQEDDSRMYLAIEDKEGEFVGVIRSDEWDRDNESVRVGSDIVPEERRKGYGTEALGAFVNYLFEEQDMHRVWLLVVDKNEGARRLYEKLGFKEEGIQREAIFRDGEYHGYIMMSVLEDEWEYDSK